MTDHDQQDPVGALLEDVQSVPPERRAAYLDEQDVDDALRDEVLSLLAAYEEDPTFVDDLAEAVVAPALGTLDAPNTGRRPSDPLRLEGAQVGRYTVTDHLGSGGMGVVYRARDPRLDRDVALKFLPPHLIDHPEAEERFVREARSAARLDHPNIATIHEIGETEAGRRFIAMAFYEGETLKAVLDREERLPLAEAIDVAIQIADGLARAHDAGITHRDVKPANVMVSETGTVKLLDFGLARAPDQSRITATGRQLGTAAYMSPEQVEGDVVDARADVWALGVVLYEMVTGQRPFEGSRRAALTHAILSEDPAPLRTHRAEASPELEHIVDRCLQRNLAERYASASPVLADLRAVRRGEAPSPSAPPSEPEEPDRSIAVLPFETLGASENTAFTDGIHGDLLTRLSNLSRFQVISRTSVRRYRNTDQPIPQIAADLGAAWVLEGEVQEAGGQVRVNTRLVNAEADQQVWARDYQRTLTADNLFEMQADITEDIARSLQAELTPEEKRQVEQRPTENLDAYRFCAQGRRLLEQRTEDSIRQAVDRFQHAIEEDARYALAWTGLVDAFSLCEYYGWPAPDDPRDPMEMAQQVVDRNPHLGEAHASLGILHSVRQEGPEALRALQRAVERSPSFAEAHVWLGWVQLCLGRPEEGLPSNQRATELSPLSPAMRVYLATSLLANGRTEQALREARRARDIQPDYGLTHFMEGLVLHHQGRRVAAASALQQALPLVSPQGTPTQAEVRAVLAVTHAASEDTRRARELLAEIDERNAPFSAGLVQAALGDAGAAFDAFEAIDDWGSFETEHFRYFFPEILGPLRENPRYHRVLQSVNRSWGLTDDGRVPQSTAAETDPP